MALLRARLVAWACITRAAVALSAPVNIVHIVADDVRAPKVSPPAHLSTVFVWLLPAWYREPLAR